MFIKKTLSLFFLGCKRVKKNVSYNLALLTAATTNWTTTMETGLWLEVYDIVCVKALPNKTPNIA